MPPGVRSAPTGRPGPEAIPTRLGDDVSSHRRRPRGTIAASDRRCYAGDATACYASAGDYEHGRGIKVDLERAAELYRRACDAKIPRGGIAAACTNLGYLYGKGRGMPKDYAKAVVLYRRGCEGGSLLGCSNLGVLYEKGLGVSRDASRARALYRSACEAKAGRACHNLGVVMRSGRGGSRDAQGAQKLFKRACDLGDPLGCRQAAWGKLRGVAGQPDFPGALVLFRRACKPKRGRPDGPSCAFLGRHRGIMTILPKARPGVCEKVGLWNARRGRLVALSDASKGAGAAAAFGKLRWGPRVLSRVRFPAQASQPLEVAFDDGKILLKAAVFPMPRGSSPTFFSTRSYRASPILWLVPGFPLRVSAQGGTLRGSLGRTETILSTSGLRIPLRCDDIALSPPPWKRLKDPWPKTIATRKKIDLLRDTDVPISSSPGAKVIATIQKTAAFFGVLGTLSGVKPSKGKGSKGSKGGKMAQSIKKKRQRPHHSVLSVELLASRGRWRQIRYVGDRYGVVGWVDKRFVAMPDPKSAIFGLGGLGLSGGRGGGGSPDAGMWRCREALPLIVRRGGQTPRSIGLLHAKVPFSIFAVKAG
ncbi:MAG: sel1 repeat family protein, partial [Deltaproteobacteria bacterium]|nr:sel1 repeat family protein [Deltaproteobacteria bacterium]